MSLKTWFESLGRDMEQFVKDCEKREGEWNARHPMDSKGRRPFFPVKDKKGKKK